jgi:hypothetical protein
MEVTIPCSDDLRHPKGTVYRTRLMPYLFESSGPSTDTVDYPVSSPHRCFNCHRYFKSVPLMYTRSIVYQRNPAVPRQCCMLIEWCGNFCSLECRTRYMDDSRDPQIETQRMHTVLADSIVFSGLELDYSISAPNHVDVASGAPPIPLTYVSPSHLTTAPRVPYRSCFEVRGVREVFFGEIEGGIGEGGIDHLLIHGKDPMPPHPISPPPAAVPAAAAARHDPRIRPSLPVWIRFTDPPCPRCWWCSQSIQDQAFPIPTHRDMINTIHVKGTFCHSACGMAYLLNQGSCVQSSVGVTHHHERIGLFIYTMVKFYGVNYGARFSVAPHFLELDEFGGDLDRKEFDLQKDISDLLTAWETAPFLSARMGMNYTRPGVVCDLASAHKGESSFEPQKIIASTTTSQTHSAEATLSLFDILLREHDASTGREAAAAAAGGLSSASGKA